VVVAFVDEHKRAFGVEPICRVLSTHGIKIAVSTYYARHSRPPAARTLRDRALGAEIERIFHDRQLGRDLVGVRKMRRLLARDPVIGERFGPPARRRAQTLPSSTTTCSRRCSSCLSSGSAQF
jgi:putative transposase